MYHKRVRIGGGRGAFIPLPEVVYCAYPSHGGGVMIKEMF
jgi:hypothetical protein